MLLERLATLTERLSNLLSDDNQETIGALLKNANRLTNTLADQGPEVTQTLASLRETLTTANQSLQSFDKLAGSAQNLVDNEGKPMAAEMRKTLEAAQKSADELSKTLADARPVMQQVRTTTLPEVEALTRDLRTLTKSLNTITRRLDQDGASGLLSSPALPDYKPSKQ